MALDRIAAKCMRLSFNPQNCDIHEEVLSLDDLEQLEVYDKIDTKAHQDLIVSAFTLIPYLLVAWGFTALTDGEASTFWKALLALIIVRTFFALIEALGGVLKWRLWGRNVLVGQALNWFTSRQFPQRKYAHDYMGNYLARIESDPEQPPALHMAATELNRMFLAYEEFGILVDNRFYDAY